MQLTSWASFMIVNFTLGMSWNTSPSLYFTLYVLSALAFSISP
jgi:hypothetical protein